MQSGVLASSIQESNSLLDDLDDLVRYNQPRPATSKPLKHATRREHTLTTNQLLVPIEHIAQTILLIRNQKVLLDTDLAELYGVSTKSFNEQVRRNLARFPADFMFQLTEDEFAALRSHFATSNKTPAGRGGRRYLPYVFTEHGAIMAATILNSPRAIDVAVYVVRAFVELREILSSNKELAAKLAELESRIERKLDTHDRAIAGLIDAIRELMRPPESSKKRPIGFVNNEIKKSRGQTPSRNQGVRLLDFLISSFKIHLRLPIPTMPTRLQRPVNLLGHFRFKPAFT